MITNKPICTVVKNLCSYLVSVIFLSCRVWMSWNIGDNRNFFLELKPTLGLYHVVLITPKTSSGKITITVVEMQQIPELEKKYSEKEISSLKWTIHKGRRKICVNFRTWQATSVLSCALTETILTSEVLNINWSWQNTSNSWQKEFIYWVTLTYFSSGALYWTKQLFISETNSIRKGQSLSHEHVRTASGINIVIWTQ